MQDHNTRAPVRTQTNPAWETIKWVIAVLAITSICHTLLTAGGVL